MSGKTIGENCLYKSVFCVGRERALEMLNMSLDDGITQLVHKYTQHFPRLK